MKTVTVIILMVFALTAKGQIYVNGEAFDCNAKYIEVTYTKVKKQINSAYVFIDYGQAKKGEFQFITNEKGDKLEFNSPAHLLNYLDKKGYDLIDVELLDVYNRHVDTVYFIYYLKLKQ